MNNRSGRTPYNHRHEIDAGIEVFPEYDWSNRRILIFQGPIQWKQIWQEVKTEQTTHN